MRRRRLLRCLSEAALAFLWLLAWPCGHALVSILLPRRAPEPCLGPLINRAPSCPPRRPQPVSRPPCSYVAYGNANTPEGGGAAACQHGAEECLYNRWINCAQRHHPAQGDWFPYVRCLADHMRELGEHAPKCATERGWDPAQLAACATGREEGGGGGRCGGRAARGPALPPTPRREAWRPAPLGALPAAWTWRQPAALTR